VTKIMKKTKSIKTIHRLKWTRSSANNFETVQDTQKQPGNHK